jgi:hypothetical protein
MMHHNQQELRSGSNAMLFEQGRNHPTTPNIESEILFTEDLAAAGWQGVPKHTGRGEPDDGIPWEGNGEMSTHAESHSPSHTASVIHVANNRSAQESPASTMCNMGKEEQVTAQASDGICAIQPIDRPESPHPVPPELEPWSPRPYSYSQSGSIISRPPSRPSSRNAKGNIEAVPMFNKSVSLGFLQRAATSPEHKIRREASYGHIREHSDVGSAMSTLSAPAAKNGSDRAKSIEAALGLRRHGRRSVHKNQLDNPLM